jgi:hypothetical protein
MFKGDEKMKLTRGFIPVLLIILLLTACGPIPGLPGTGAPDILPADVTATAIASKLFDLPLTNYGGYPNPVYYGPGCDSSRSTTLVYYTYAPETWITLPSPPGLTGVRFSAYYEFMNPARTYGFVSKSTYDMTRTEDGHMYAIIDLSGETFDGKKGVLELSFFIEFTTVSSLLPPDFSTSTAFTSDPILIDAYPCSEKPSLSSSLRGRVSIFPNPVYMGDCKGGEPTSINVQYKPDGGSSMATAVPAKYRVVFSPFNATTKYGDIIYDMFWVGGTDGYYEADVPIKDWSLFTGPGGTDVRVEVLRDGSSSPEVIYRSTDTVILGFSSPVEIKVCESPKLTSTCATTFTTGASNSSGTVVTFEGPSVSGDCGPFTAICTPPSGSTFSFGLTTVVCTTSDGCGNTNSCSLNITLGAPAATNIPLAITCPGTLTVTALSAAGANVTFPAPTVLGGCQGPAPTFDCMPPSGSLFPVGSSAVTCIARDACANTNSCTFLVTVNPPRVVPSPTSQPEPTNPPPTCSQWTDPTSCGQNNCTWTPDNTPPNFGTCK